MTWAIHKTNETTGQTIYIKTEGNKIFSGSSEDSAFQSWLSANKDNLPTEIDKQVKEGTLTIQDAD
tara:strand:+ start:372 stop:569 length:198 start_codon:yes stop_codon:yes gene_type:complete